MPTEYLPLNPYNEDSPHVKVLLSKKQSGSFDVRRYNSKVFMYNVEKNELMDLKNGLIMVNQDPQFTKSPIFKTFLSVQHSYNNNLINFNGNYNIKPNRPYNSELLKRRRKSTNEIIQNRISSSEKL